MHSKMVFIFELFLITNVETTYAQILLLVVIIDISLQTKLICRYNQKTDCFSWSDSVYNCYELMHTSYSGQKQSENVKKQLSS